ncbi:MAG TPA: GNAT family N-acetyltransferase [Jatrophihabitans sp.]|nr:GNAT family N-acetyltransferase [Jatrophihabitans sp.]
MAATLDRSVVIRPKTAADTGDLLTLALAVHHHDGYPRYLPDDLAGFVTSSHQDEAWVAELDGRIVGHVALHRAAESPMLPAARRATGLGPDRLAMLARLLVGPTVRRLGIAQQLIAAAVQHAQARGRRVVLDVVREADAAIRLYETLGWVRLESLRLPIRDGQVLDLWVYLSPAPPG